jgi:serine/threonine-protein kinase
VAALFYQNDPLIGKTIDNRYVIDSLIAKGGMGRVYAATQKSPNRKVALKVLMLDEDRASEVMERFKREADSLGRMDHKNIVTVYEAGETENGIHYIAMQMVNGKSLADYYGELKEKRQFISPDELLAILEQVVDALDYAHERGVIHRDIKPGNIMLAQDENGNQQAILMDFGLVMDRGTDTTQGVPTQGLAFGTPRYIAPEQAISSQQASPQSDIYSLGVVVFELLTGRPPFDDSDTPMSVALAHINKTPPSPRNIRPDLPEAVSKAILKALEKEPKNRYPTASAFYEALVTAYREGVAPASSPKSALPNPITAPSIPHSPTAQPQPQNRRLGAIIVVVALLMLLILGGIWVATSGGDDDDDGDDNIAAEVTDAVPTDEPQATDEPDPTDEPTDAPQPTTAPAEGSTPILQFFYGNSSFTIRNPTRNTQDYSGIVLRNGENVFSFAEEFTFFDDARWARTRCITLVPGGTTLRRPTECNEAIDYGPYNVDAAQPWTFGESFEVYKGNRLLKTCEITAASCVIDSDTFFDD